MTLEEKEQRKAELVSKIDEVSDMEALNEVKSQLEELENTEVEEVKEEVEETEVKEERSLEQDVEILEERKENNVEVVERKEIRKMEEKIEMRNSAEYVRAYAEYLKSGNDEEVRSLLTENVEGTIAVPDMVYDVVRTAWDKEQIMSLVRKAELKGNIKVNFEISGSDAVVHTEGTGAVSEEELVEGIVTIVPANIKKWISISDEVLSMRGEAFLTYIYNELTYKIVKKCADVVVDMIKALPQNATPTSVSADKVAVAPSTSAVAQGIAHLSDESENPVVIMNKLTYANFKKVQYDNGYGVDVFEGLSVKFNNRLPAYDSASEGDVYMIVGDLGEGILANFPNGINNVEFTFDALSRKKEDLVEVLGKEYVGLGAISNKAFTLISKPAVQTI